MNGKTCFLTAIGLAFVHYGAPTLAADAASPREHRVQEASDQELASMRGRYTVGNNAVVWFGVSMVSTWQNSAGQVLQSTLSLDINFSGKQPQITFVPNVTITTANAPMPNPGTPAAGTLAIGPSRNVSGLGLANVGGVVQSVQVAGDGNTASNLASLASSYGNAPASSTANGYGGNTQATTANGNASATASYSNGTAQVLLDIAGDGTVRQWIQSGSLGQSVQLTADNQVVSNLLNVDLVRQAMTSNTQLMQNLTQGVAQATNLTRGISNH
jgi:hypothetical protein